jgi:hypothetical protein
VFVLQALDIASTTVVEPTVVEASEHVEEERPETGTGGTYSNLDSILHGSDRILDSSPDEVNSSASIPSTPSMGVGSTDTGSTSQSAPQRLQDPPIIEAIVESTEESGDDEDDDQETESESTPATKTGGDSPDHTDGRFDGESPPLRGAGNEEAGDRPGPSEMQIIVSSTPGEDELKQREDRAPLLPASLLQGLAEWEKMLFPSNPALVSYLSFVQSMLKIFQVLAVLTRFLLSIVGSGCNRAVDQPGFGVPSHRRALP